MNIRIKKGLVAPGERIPITLTIGREEYVNVAAAAIMFNYKQVSIIQKCARNKIRPLGGGTNSSYESYYSVKRLNGSKNDKLDDVPGLITLKGFCKKYGVSLDYVRRKMKGSKSMELLSSSITTTTTQLVIEEELLDLIGFDEFYSKPADKETTTETLIF